jgi:hypothetical protein
MKSVAERLQEPLIQMKSWRGGDPRQAMGVGLGFRDGSGMGVGVDESAIFGEAEGQQVIIAELSEVLAKQF